MTNANIRNFDRSKVYNGKYYRVKVFDPEDEEVKIRRFIDVVVKDCGALTGIQELSKGSEFYVDPEDQYNKTETKYDGESVETVELDETYPWRAEIHRMKKTDNEETVFSHSHWVEYTEREETGLNDKVKEKLDEIEQDE